MKNVKQFATKQTKLYSDNIQYLDNNSAKTESKDFSVMFTNYVVSLLESLKKDILLLQRALKHTYRKFWIKI